MEKVIVTGGAGFIGSHIVDKLVDTGYDVHVIDNLFSGSERNINPKATFHNVDIRDLGALKILFIGAKYVFHKAALLQVQASIENPVETSEVNVAGVLNVLEACRANNVKRLIFASSCAAYGDQKVLPLVETMDAVPLSPYGAYKYVGEVYCSLWSRIYSLETVSLRYSNVYGPRQSSVGAYASVIAKFMDLKKQNKSFTIYGDGEQTRSFVHVRDVANANIKAMLSGDVGAGEVINIGTVDRYSINKIAQIIGGDIVYAEALLEIRDSYSDITKAKKLLDWEPAVSIEGGLEELKTLI